MTLDRYVTLPVPDQFANYWFDEPGAGSHPAILTRRANKRSSFVAPYMLSLGPSGVVWSGGKIMEFPSPRMALMYLQDLIRGDRVFIPE